MAVESSWWPLSPWLSPAAAWLVLFSAVVGAVVLMSSRGHSAPPPSTGRRSLTRSASSMVLERLSSFSVFSVVLPVSGVRGDVDSITASPPSETMLTPAAAEHAAASATRGAEAAEESPLADEAHPDPVVVSPSQPPQAAALAGEAASSEEEERPSKRKELAANATVVKRRGRAFAEEVEGKAEVNARAERFIRQFREDLRLQRLMSVLNRTHTLNGGGGGSPAP
ncbi:uncharacterized protein LOC107304724 [Oryza brachyantha]|uniref:DUF4408 domain-containing protein n=1 Tax=Oryza brachyantha TaxID=4533 RepID=J3MSU2_ORYBR|nr:uncharacterized protein LOC107304724 [Oryza brachyantha]